MNGPEMLDQRMPHQMPFGEFAVACEANGALDRWPDIVAGIAVVGFSVYMNGDASKTLPEKDRKTEYQNVTVSALTGALGLDGESFRDNLRVAEILATRTAWMNAVREAKMRRDEIALPEQVMEDYMLLADTKKWVGHAWVQDELLRQRKLSGKLETALKQAEEVLGVTVVDRLPYEVSRGAIIAQNSEFSVQSLDNGETVTHENRRLESLPTIGNDVTVTYYRGRGQIQDNTQEIQFSRPFVDDKTQDLAIAIQKPDGEVSRILLFNGIVSFAVFVGAHNLDTNLIAAAMDVRTETDIGKERGALLDEAFKTHNGIMSPDLGKGGYTGKVTHVSKNGLFFVQDVGRGNAVVHANEHMDRPVKLNEVVAINYRAGRASPEVKVQDCNKGHAR